MSDLGAVLAAHRVPPAAPDLERMRTERLGRLRAAMEAQGIDVALLLHRPHVTYAAGVAARGVDGSVAVHERPVAVVTREPGAEPHVVDALDPELDEHVEQLASCIAELAGPLDGRRVAVDELTGAMRRVGLLARAEVLDAGAAVAAAKLLKTPDELACIASAQRANEVAMTATMRAAVPGARRSQVAGRFLAELARLDAGPNLIDPIFQVMPRRIADGPRTTTGHVAFPTGHDDATFATGDVVWVDTGVDHHGYASDFGRTWLVGRDPTPAERRLHDRWCDVVLAVLDVLAPGTTAGDLCRAAEAANDGETPWLPHFYLAHGVGVESAEMPLVGTDLGREFDDSVVLAPGMVLVLEPVVWEDGVGGHRAEEIVAVTDDGWRHLGGGHGYEPFEP